MPISISLLALLLLASPQAAQRPNIVLILADDLGWQDLSGYGARDLRTPNVDRLIARGMKFTRAYANCPVCTPTRAALLTGRYPELVGVPGVIRETTPHDNWGYLSSEATLLPELLRDAGYHTGLVGKWHLGNTEDNWPTARGFDEFFGMVEGMVYDYYRFTMFGARERVDLWDGDRAVELTGEHATELFTRRAIDFLRARAAAADEAPRPFFLYLAYNAPHTPIQPPDDRLAAVRKRAPELGGKRQRLVALIEDLDAGVGRVVDALDELGLREDTLVIFVSDNGGHLAAGADNGDLRGGKQMMYEGGLRVPLVVAWPDHVRPGSATDRIAITMDLFPTCCEVAGVDVPSGIDGRSLVPTLRGRGQAFERDLFWTRREGGGRYQGQTIWAMRRGDWKLLQNLPEEPFQLFDLARDPGEKLDRRDENAKVFRELSAALRAHVQRGGGVPWQKTKR